MTTPSMKPWNLNEFGPARKGSQTMWYPGSAFRRQPNQFGLIAHCAECHTGIFEASPVIETPVGDEIELRHKRCAA